MEKTKHYIKSVIFDSVKVDRRQVLAEPIIAYDGFFIMKRIR